MMHSVFSASLKCMLLFSLLSIWACSSGGDGNSSDGDADASDDPSESDADYSDDDLDDDIGETDGDADAENCEADDYEIADEEEETEVEAETWVFDRSNYEAVNGWILLDYDRDSIKASINKAAEYGVNHIQLSHDIIMDIDDLLGDDEAVLTRVEIINEAIELAHGHGMKVYVWAHEFNNVGLNVCFDPSDPIWEQRGDAYRQGFARVPQLDGVILMYGSSELPPWYALCTCDFCSEQDGQPWDVPPSGERLRIVTEKIGGIIVNELGLDLVIRTFVHEPAEIEWHNQGLSGARGLEFTAMHKSDVQDWQPYNPPEGCFGNIGNHAAVMETDVAGEYFGRSILPWCAPGYYWYRLRYAWDINAVGFVARIQRGSNTALGTPNEVNIYALKELLKDIDKPLAEIWSGFISDFYKLDSSDALYPTLQRILADTFDVRRKSHYVLGIWALEKSSDIPNSAELGEFNGRGKMPKWDSDWQGIWDSLNVPERATVLNVWQEGCEATAIAERDLADVAALADKLDALQYEDLLRRLKHQKYAAEAWRAIKMFIWSRRASTAVCGDCAAWVKWSHEELGRIRQAMIDDGLENASPASPARIAEFINNTASLLTAQDAQEPPPALFSPLKVLESSGNSVRLSFSAGAAVRVYVDYGLEIPDYGQSYDAAEVEAGENTEVLIAGLEPMKRYVVRLRAEYDGITHHGGDYWIYTN